MERHSSRTWLKHGRLADTAEGRSWCALLAQAPPVKLWLQHELNQHSENMCSVHMLGNVSIPNTANTQRSPTYCISMCFNAATGPSRHFASSLTWKHWDTSRSAIWKRNYTSWWHTLICVSTWWSATSSLSSDVKLELSDHPSERQLWEEVFPKRIS